MQRSGYLPTLDGWRAVAILLVLGAHSNPWSLGRFNNHWLVVNGYRGVQLFFALSGYLICTRLLREEQRFGSISMRSFYARRLFRIQPAAMVFLLALVVLTVFRGIPEFWPGIAGAALMIRNLWPRALANGYWFTEHFWSLAVEEHFYLLLPGFLVLVRRRRFTILAVTVLVLELWHMVVGLTPRLKTGPGWIIGHRTDIALNSILLASVFAVALNSGSVLAWFKKFVRPWAAWLYTAVFFFIASRHLSMPIQDSLLSVFPVLIVAAVLHPESLTGKFLELSAVRWIGRISYSLYLWQQLFLVPPEAQTPPLLHANGLVCWAATFACAIASYYLIETPLIRVGHRFAKRFERKRSPQTAMA